MKLFGIVVMACCLFSLHSEIYTSATAILTDASHVVVASYSEPISVSNRIMNSNSTAPLFYGWFFNNSTAESINIIGKKYFLSSYDKIPEFRKFIDELMERMNITNPLEFYVKPLDPDSGTPDMTYHTTAKFCGRNLDSDAVEECSQYLKQVGQYLGRPYQMHLVGLFFTNNTYGIRVKLTGEEQKLFREDTRTNSAQQSEIEPNNEIQQFHQDGPEIHFSYEPYYYTHDTHEIGMSNTPFYPGIKFRPQKKSFHPTESRAHITLGCAPGVPAVQTGLDLLNIIDLEVSSFPVHKDFQVGGNEIPNAVLRYFKTETETGEYDAAAFVLYPEDEMVADAIFDAYL